MLTSVSAALIPTVVRAAEEGAEAGGTHPYLIGGIAFGILMTLLFITTRFNSER
jgi:Na+/melibiose symporter-like transporter